METGKSDALLSTPPAVAGAAGSRRAPGGATNDARMTAASDTARCRGVAAGAGDAGRDAAVVAEPVGACVVPQAATPAAAQAAVIVMPSIRGMSRRMPL